jgi:selenocysteine lyase/cysteine desulfurase
VRPQSEEPLGHRFETGTQAYELLAGMVAAVEYVESIGWDAIVGWEQTLGERFLDGLPAGCRLHGLPTMAGRVPTFAFTMDGLPAGEIAARLGERGFAVWHGNYYAVEIMKRLGLEDGGAVRVGLVHYNTLDEVDRLLEELARLE